MFSPSVGKHFCIFEGQAKKRFGPDSHSIPFEIPLLVEFDVFIHGYNALRSQFGDVHIILNHDQLILNHNWSDALYVLRLSIYLGLKHMGHASKSW